MPSGEKPDWMDGIKSISMTVENKKEFIDSSLKDQNTMKQKQTAVSAYFTKNVYETLCFQFPTH